MRASDSDRESVVERLRDAHAEGRLTIAEFQERLDSTYEARTLGELVVVTQDLPTTSIAQPAHQPAQLPPTAGSAQAEETGWRGMRAVWGSWASAVLVTTVT
jgi:hypothetical protein